MAKKRNEEYSDDEYPDEPNFDDAEGFVDDVTDEGTQISWSALEMPAWPNRVCARLYVCVWIRRPRQPNLNAFVCMFVCAFAKALMLLR